MSFYGGTYIDYCRYCDDRYSGIFELKKTKMFLTDLKGG